MPSDPSGLSPPGSPAGTWAARGGFALYLLLGSSAGLPYYMFSTILSARLARHDVDLVLIGFFGSMVAMAFTSTDTSLPLTALFAVLLAFWTTTLEVAADAWRIDLAPTPETQGPLTATNLWGYRSAMVAAGSGALIVADHANWTWAYLVIAAGAFAPLPILAAAMRSHRDRPARGERGVALATGLGMIVVARNHAATISHRRATAPHRPGRWRAYSRNRASSARARAAASAGRSARWWRAPSPPRSRGH